MNGRDFSVMLLTENELIGSPAEADAYKHKEAFSTLVESLTQMTHIDFTNFLKLVQFTI